ncbi:MAG: hypothetical protein RLZ98_1416 [Pseudomonadota bacterium]|jgi:xanthine dehydrogenase accessory factor
MDDSSALSRKDDVDVLANATQWLEADGSVVMGTVVDTWGSAPVPTGGQIAVARDGRFVGSVSGGCIEGEVLTAAEDVFENGKAQTLEFGVEDETAWSVGLPCGGRIKVFVERFDKGPGGDLLRREHEARERRKGLVVRTNLETGAREVFERTDSNLPPDVARRFSTAKSALEAGPEGQVFTHALVPPARIIAIGAGHISQVLSEIAKLAGYEVIVVDPRTAFASAERFPGIDLRAEWPQDILPKLGLDSYTALAVLAHVAHIDDEALKVGLKSDCLYIGALGSKKNHTARVGRLKEAGLTDEEIAKIKNPIGIDIGAQSPAEIALAVMAEIVRAVRGPKLG